MAPPPYKPFGTSQAAQDVEMDCREGGVGREELPGRREASADSDYDRLIVTRPSGPDLGGGGGHASSSREHECTLPSTPGFSAERSLPTPPPSALPSSFAHPTRSPTPLRDPVSPERYTSDGYNLPPLPPTPSPSLKSTSKPRAPKKTPTPRTKRPRATVPLLAISSESSIFDAFVELDQLVPAGTIFLPEHHFVSTPTPATDGWTRLSPNLLSGPPFHEPGTAEDQTARVLACVLDMNASLLLRATVKVVDQGALLRIYLVPTDLPELSGNMLRDRTRVRMESMETVLGAIECRRIEWVDGILSFDGPAPRLMDEEDQRSLPAVYRGLDSPPFDPQFIDGLEGVDFNVKELLKDALVGVYSSSRDTFLDRMQTDLYRSQRASLTKMLVRELVPQSIAHPEYQLYTSCIDPTVVFYLSALTGECILLPPRVMQPKGGILADIMGVGKTAICLALILSTQGQLPTCSKSTVTPDGKITTTRPPLLTPISINFPFTKELAEQAHFRPRVPLPIFGYERTPAEDAQHQILVDRQVAYDRAVARPPLPSLRDILLNLIRSTSQPTLTQEQQLRGPALQKDLRATVPFYYQHPQQKDLESRTGRPRPLLPTKMLVSSATLVVVPCELLTQWSDEIRKHVEEGVLKVLVLKDANKTYQPVDLAEYDVVLVTVTVFCGALHQKSTLPFDQIYWRRLLIDEGHVLGGDSQLNETSWGAVKLLCESRWAISAIPSKGLREGPSDEEVWRATTCKTGKEAKPFESDLSRMGVLLSNFIHHPAFRIPAGWNELIKKPMLRQRRGAARLLRVLEGIVVRNQPSDVKLCFDLPPLVSTIQYLSFEPSECKMYNALIAFFTANSILSQRTDSDYLFHGIQAKYLRELTLNLRASSLFFTSPDFVVKSEEYLREWPKGVRKIENISKEDWDGLHRAHDVLREALDDEGIKLSTITSLSPGLEVRGLDSRLAGKFGGLVGVKEEGDGVGEGVARILPSSRLVELRVAVEQMRRPGVAAWVDDEDLVEEVLTYDAQRIANLVNPEVSATKEPKINYDLPLLPLPSSSSFLDANLGRSTSAKINFVVDTVRRNSKEKFLVFSNTLPDLLFATLSEAFDLYGISHTFFASKTAAAREFNESTVEQCQVLLIKVNGTASGGARGLNLTAASFVIFLEPIWSPDVAAQAVKRAHRLGQTKEVKHITLVIKGSFEDELLQRGEKMTVSDRSNAAEPQHDSTLAAILISAPYLSPNLNSTATPHTTRVFDQSLVARYNSNKRKVSTEGVSPKKKAKRVKLSQ